MSGDQLAGALASVMMLVLVGGALVARRLDWSRTIQMALAWAAILLVIVAAIRLLGNA